METTNRVQMIPNSILSSSNGFISVETAVKSGLIIPEYIKAICKHCRKPFEYVGMVHPFQPERLFLIHPLECQCEGAAAERREALIREERERRESQRRDLMRKLEKSNLGERFHDRTFENFKVTDKNRSAYETMLKYCDNFAEYKKTGQGIYLTGTYGTGKTHLAAAVVHRLIEHCYSCIFGTTISLFSRIKRTYGSSKEDEAEVLNDYATVDLLVLDDFGKERSSSWTVEQVYNIINTRYENYKPVIITSNYSLSELVKRLTIDGDGSTAEAISSRLHEMCVGILLNGDDYRTK